MKGWYSVVQYCPDLGRLEVVNLGLVLLCEQAGFIQAKMETDLSRVTRFFPGTDLEQIRWMSTFVPNRIIEDGIRGKEALDHFVRTRANSLILTDLRSVIVDDPIRDLDYLFERLVKDPAAVAVP